MEKRARVKIIIAVIGLIGTVSATVITNWDKLRPKPEELINPTNDIEIEVRHHLELSGMREMMRAMKARMEQKYRDKYDLTEEELASLVDVSTLGNDFLEVFVEIYKRHLSLEEIRELNRLHSSEIMVTYRKKQMKMIPDLIEETDKLAEKKYKAWKKLHTH